MKKKIKQRIARRYGIAKDKLLARERSSDH